MPLPLPRRSVKRAALGARSLRGAFAAAKAAAQSVMARLREAALPLKCGALGGSVTPSCLSILGEVRLRRL